MDDSQTEQEDLEYAQAIENSLKPEDVLCQFCNLKFDTEDERLLHLVNQCPSIEDENKGRVVDCQHPAPETGTLISMNAKHSENILPPTSPQIISTVRTDYTKQGFGPEEEENRLQQTSLQQDRTQR